LQGGIIAAIIGNSISPCCVLIAPPNVTSFLEFKFVNPITLKMYHGIVVEKLVERLGLKLTYKAVIHDPQGKKIIGAKAIHWI